MMYIGKTGHRLSDPFGEHVHSVEGYNQNPLNHGDAFPVAERFNLSDFNNIHDTCRRVSVVKQVRVVQQLCNRKKGGAFFGSHEHHKMGM